MLNELQILEKHLGQANTDMQALKHETKKFVSDIGDANDFSTALQLINKALKSMLKACENKDFTDAGTKVEIANFCMQTVDSSVFMNISLFDNSYLVNVGNKGFTYEISSPLKLLAKHDYEDMVAYMQDKLDESKTLLGELGMAIMASTPNESFGINSPAGLDINSIKNLFAKS